MTHEVEYTITNEMEYTITNEMEYTITTGLVIVNIDHGPDMLHECIELESFIFTVLQAQDAAGLLGGVHPHAVLVLAWKLRDSVRFFVVLGDLEWQLIIATFLL